MNNGTRTGDGKIVITGQPEAIQLAKAKVLEVVGIETAEVGPHGRASHVPALFLSKIRSTTNQG